MVDTIFPTPNTYTPRQSRQTIAPAFSGATAARPFGVLSGVRPGTSQTTVTTTTSTVTVQPFGGIADPQSSNLAGPYEFAFDAVHTFTLTAQSSSVARSDIVYVQFQDNAEDGTGAAGSSGASLVYLAGSTVTIPTPPNTRTMVIAVINVPVVGTSPTVTWVAPYCIAAGGLGYVNTFSQLPATAVQGTMMYAYDTGITWRWYDLYNSSTNPAGRATAGWKPWETAVPIAYTTALFNYNVATDTPVRTWTARSGRIFCEGSLLITSGGGMTGTLQIPLPFTAAAKYASTTSGLQYDLGGGLYDQVGTGSFPFRCVMDKGSIDRVTPSLLNAAGTYAVFSSGVTATAPVAQSAGYSVSWNFEYDPA